jgi:hypothetical protein
MRRACEVVLPEDLCHTRECALVGGEIDYRPEPLEPPAEGTVLTCGSRAPGDIEIDL